MQRHNVCKRSEYLLRQAHHLEGRQGPKPLRLDTFKGKRIEEFDFIVLIDNILNYAWDENVFLKDIPPVLTRDSGSKNSK